MDGEVIDSAEVSALRDKRKQCADSKPKGCFAGLHGDKCPEWAFSNVFFSFSLEICYNATKAAICKSTAL